MPSSKNAFHHGRYKIIETVIVCMDHYNRKNKFACVWTVLNDSKGETYLSPSSLIRATPGMLLWI